MKWGLCGLIMMVLLTEGRGQEPFVGPPAPGSSIPEGETSTTPISDKEETGALTDMLPDRVELLELPAEEPAESDEWGERNLFPREIWSGAAPEAETGLATGAPPAEEALELKPEEIASVCFGSSPPPALNDPQHLLTRAQAAPLEHLLRESLAARGSFQCCVTVLLPTQQIPVELNPPELLQRWYGRTKSLLVIYYLGKPERAQVFFSPESLAHHRAEDLRQVVDFGLREAARMTHPVSQLERFCYKTVIRLDRLHRQGVVTPGDDMPIPAAAVAASSGGIWWAIAVGIQAIALAGGVFWWWKRRRAAGRIVPGQPVYLPDLEVPPRLGAPHSGGTGATLHFGAGAHRL